MTSTMTLVTHPPGPTCRTCGASIVWGFTRAGIRVPVDPEPVAGGNLDLGDDGHGNIEVRYVQPDSDTVRHVSHFATCPDADEHRRRTTRRRTR